MKQILVAALVFLAMSVQASNVTYYGDKFHGRKTASGEKFNQNAMTCASNKHAFGTYLKVTNSANGKSVVCRVNDRGGFSKYGVSVDLSKAAFSKIASLAKGRVRAVIEIATKSDDEESHRQASEQGLAQDKMLLKQKVDEVLSQIQAVTTTTSTRIMLANHSTN